MKLRHLSLSLLILTYFFLFSFLSIEKHRSLNSTYLDLGLESQAVWNTSQGRFFETSFGERGQTISALSYHFTPIILLIAPLYRLFPNPETLLILQSLVLSLGAVAVYLIALKILDNPILSLTFAATYLLYPALEYSNLSDFHYVTLATTFLLFAFYFLLDRRWIWFTTFLILSVSAKENLALEAILLGVYLFLFLKQRKRGGVNILFFSLYFLVSVFYLMPIFGGGFGAIGRYSTLTSNPVKSLISLFNLDKLRYLFHLFISVGFLSVLAPGALFLASSELLLNLLSDYNPQWQVKFHYTAAITPFVFIAAIYGARRLITFLRNTTLLHSKVVNIKGQNLEYVISFYLLIITLIWNVLHSPSPLFYKFDWSKYQETNETKKVREILKKIPSDASVSAMNNLGPHLSNRRFLYRFPIKALEADYVVVDPSVVGKDFNLSQIKPLEYQKYLKDLQRSRVYEMIAERSRLLIFKKKA